MQVAQSGLVGENVKMRRIISVYIQVYTIKPTLYV
jgi:hypothetical protein